MKKTINRLVEALKDQIRKLPYKQQDKIRNLYYSMKEKVTIKKIITILMVCIMIYVFRVNIIIFLGIIDDFRTGDIYITYDDGLGIVNILVTALFSYFIWKVSKEQINITKRHRLDDRMYKVEQKIALLRRFIINANKNIKLLNGVKDTLRTSESSEVVVMDYLYEWCDLLIIKVEDILIDELRIPGKPDYIVNQKMIQDDLFILKNIINDIKDKREHKKKVLAMKLDIFNNQTDSILELCRHYEVNLVDIHKKLQIRYKKYR